MRAAADNAFDRVLNPHGGAYIYSDTHKYWIHVIFCYNSSLCSPFCLLFGQYYLVKLF